MQVTVSLPGIIMDACKILCKKAATLGSTLPSTQEKSSLLEIINMHHNQNPKNYP